MEIHNPIRADGVSSPPGYECQPRLCSHLSQVGGHLTGRNGREGFPGTGLGACPMWQRAGVVLFFYLELKKKLGFNDRQGKMFIYLNTLENLREKNYLKHTIIKTTLW